MLLTKFSCYLLAICISFRRAIFPGPLAIFELRCLSFLLWSLKSGSSLKILCDRLEFKFMSLIIPSLLLQSKGYWLNGFF